MNGTGKRIEFWNEWDYKTEAVIDATRPTAERMAALHWIEDAIGEPRSTEADLERHAAEMRM